MTGLFSRSEPLVKLNQGALKDPRVTVINDDAGRWLESHAEVYDYIVVDFPDFPDRPTWRATWPRTATW